MHSKGIKTCLETYRITAKFTNEERYGLTSQIRRSAVFIPSNMEEGYGRKTTANYIRMPFISCGSVCELETQILLDSKNKHGRNRKNFKGTNKIS
jgi:four helix bundle protein